MKRERLSIKQKIAKKIELRHQNLVFIDKKGGKIDSQNRKYVYAVEKKPNEIKSEEIQLDVQYKQLTLNFLNDKGEEIMDEQDMLRIYGKILPSVVKPQQIDVNKSLTFSLLRLIPKRIFFYWGGSNISWMRYMTLFSFRKMNPDWEMVLYVSQNNMKIKGWKTCENQDYYSYMGVNYFNKIKDLNIKIEKAEFPREIRDRLKNMSPIHEGDIFRCYQLYLNGGFYCDMDVLFFRPIDDFYNKIISEGYDTIIHEYQSKERTLTIGFLGASVNNEYYKNLFEFGVDYYINNIDKINNNYQSLGVQLIYLKFTGNNYATRVIDNIILKYPHLNFYNLPTALIYQYDWREIKHCFTHSLDIKAFGYESIGYHWYGGGSESQKYNNILTEKNYKNHKTTFSTIADEVINMKVDKENRVIENNPNQPKISIIMSSFNRPKLLDFGLSSLTKQKIDYPLEIIVVNDGKDDDTKNICDSYKNKLNIKYIFSGYRNSKNIVSRTPAIPLNIGIKNSEGDIIILTCPEICHLNDGINNIVKPLIKNRKYLTIPEFMYFDDSGKYTNNLLKKQNGNLDDCSVNRDDVQMPFLMGMWKDQIMEIGGYDEDFIGYAADDNDFVDRLKLNGCVYHSVDAKAIHLYHGKRCLGTVQWDNPAWAYNYKLYIDRKGILVRNVNKEWGSNIRISIVTAYYNRKILFFETLKSIAKSKFKDFELIVVDDCSLPNERLEEYLEEFPFMKIIRLEKENKWYVNPCIPFNIGIRAAVGDIIILQNPECLHVHDILTYINNNVDNTNYISVSTYALNKKLTRELSKHNGKNTVVDFYKSIINDKWKNKTFGLSNVGEIGWYNHTKYLPSKFHFCSAIAKKNMDLLGGFDERFAYGIGYDDDDFLERINRLKLDVILSDEVSVIHQWHPSVFYDMPNTAELQEKNKAMYESITQKEIKIKAN